MATLDREQRDALHKAVLTDLLGIDDILMLIDSGQAEEAQRLWRKYVSDCRLLDDLGWEIPTAGERFALTMPREELVAVLERLQADAQGALRDDGEVLANPGGRFRHMMSADEVEEWTEERRALIDEDLDLVSACRSTLAELGAS